MIISYFRSSSYNTFDNCEMQYYINYVIGLEKTSGKSASMGNIVHKVLECIALYKLCLQNGKDSFIDDNLGKLTLEDCRPDNLIDISFDWHVKHFKHNWDLIKDLKDCRKWTHMALNFKNGLFDPRKRKVITPELKFDFEIKKPWAKYEYTLPDGKILKGNLSIKGTIDLVTEVRPNVYEIIDWKTGSTTKDFATGKNKDFDSLHTDPQLRLYHYAAHQVYPDINDIIMTIYFIRAPQGGPFSLMLSKKDLLETEKIIEKQFNKVRKTTIPALNPGPPWSDNPNPYVSGFKCFKLCDYSKPSSYDAGKSVCQFFKDEIVKIGIDKVTEKYANLDKISHYGIGGGSGYHK